MNDDVVKKKIISLNGLYGKPYADDLAEEYVSAYHPHRNKGFLASKDRWQDVALNNGCDFVIPFHTYRNTPSSWLKWIIKSEMKLRDKYKNTKRKIFHSVLPGDIGGGDLVTIDWDYLGKLFNEPTQVLRDNQMISRAIRPDSKKIKDGSYLPRLFCDQRMLDNQHQAWNTIDTDIHFSGIINNITLDDPEDEDCFTLYTGCNDKPKRFSHIYNETNETLERLYKNSGATFEQYLAPGEAIAVMNINIMEILSNKIKGNRLSPYTETN